MTFELGKNRTYYIRVRSDEWSDNAPYALSVQRCVKAPSKPVLKSVKAGKRKVKMSYYKSSYATKYQIAIKKKGGSWKYYDNTNLSKTFKKLKKGKKYTVKVRAKRQFEGKWYTGSWSAKKTVKVK